MSQVWDCVALGQSETLVLLAIADHADDRGHCWPAIDRIAMKARLKRRQTQTVIKRLEQLGYLQVDRRALQLGKGHTNRYTVIPKGAVIAPMPGEGCSPEQERVQPGARKGAIATAPESSLTIKNHQQEALNTPAEKNPERLRQLAATLRKRLAVV